MNTDLDTVLAAIDAATVPACAVCGGPMGGSPSLYYCGELCQETFHAGRSAPLEKRPRPTQPRQPWFVPMASLDGVWQPVGWVALEDLQFTPDGVGQTAHRGAMGSLRAAHLNAEMRIELNPTALHRALRQTGLI